MSDYTRPLPTDTDREHAKKTAEKLVTTHGIVNLGRLLAILCLENVMLVREINEHRAALGIDPLPTYEV